MVRYDADTGFGRRQKGAKRKFREYYDDDYSRDDMEELFNRKKKRGKKTRRIKVLDWPAD